MDGAARVVWEDRVRIAKQPLRAAVTILGMLAAGAVAVAGVVFAISEGINIFDLATSEEYPHRAITVLVRVLEAVAIILAVAAFAMDILEITVTKMWGRDISPRDLVTLLRQLEDEAEGTLIPTVAVYSALKIMEFAIRPTWPADPNGWVEPVAFAGLILLSLLIHRVLSHRHGNAHAGGADHSTPVEHSQGGPEGQQDA